VVVPGNDQRLCIEDLTTSNCVKCGLGTAYQKYFEALCYNCGVSQYILHHNAKGMESKNVYIRIE